jgi:ankyrin repeat protein
VQALLASNAAIGATGARGGTALHWAASEGHADVVLSS